MLLDRASTPRIKVSLPWNSANFVPLNGFHPLYQFLYSSDGSTLDLRSLDFLRWQDLLEKADNAAFLSEFLTEANSILRSDESEEASEFWHFFDFNDALVDEISDSQIKLVHTSPVWAGVKPFVLHVESFETVFFPWSIGDPFLSHTPPLKLARIKRFLLDILESQDCVAIVSHVEATLEQFRRFFASDQVSAKLRYCPIGFPAAHVPRALGSSCRFLFPASLHGGVDNLAARGFPVVLRFMAKWLKIYPADEFVFLSPIDEVPLKGLGLPVQAQAALESPNVFSFNGDYLDRNEHRALLGASDFVLVPSRQLHSASVLGSMGLGAIPVVSDLAQLKAYGVDDTNAVVLPVREHIDAQHSEVFGEVWPHDAFLEVAEVLADQMVERLRPLRADPSLRQAVSQRATNHVATRFSPMEARRRFEEIVTTATSQAPTSVQRATGALGTCWRGHDRFGHLASFAPGLRPVLPTDFDRRPRFTPLVDLGSIRIFGDGRSYYAAHADAPGSSNFFSILRPNPRFLSPDTFSAWAYPASWAGVVDSAMVAMSGSPARPAARADFVRTTVMSLLRFGAAPVRRHPRLRDALKMLGVHKLVGNSGYGRVWEESAPGFHRRS